MRREKTITLRDREQDLTFVIQEMSATQLERWLLRALILLSGADMSGLNGQEALDFASGKIASADFLRLFGTMDYAKAEPLLDELLECCTRVVENVQERCTRKTVDNYIQDVATLFALKKEALAMNLAPLGSGGLWPSRAAANTAPPASSPDTPPR